jgi:hypothetical protein
MAATKSAPSKAKQQMSAPSTHFAENFTPAVSHTMQSRVLQSLAYNGESGVAEIEFVRGAKIRVKLPFSEYLGLKQSDSPGQYFHREIRGKFPWSYVQQSPERESA